MGQDFYSSEEYNYLEHHGILGMKWGKKNGPPYPLSEAKHDRIVEKYEKKRAKIARDPAKLKKYADKYNFTNEEIETALKRFDTKKKIDERIDNKQKEARLSAIKKQLSKDAATFEKNYDKFTKEEAELALERLSTKQRAHEARLKEMRRPKDKFDITKDYLSSIASAVDSISKVSKGFKEFRENWVNTFGGYSKDEMRLNWLRKHSTGKHAGADDSKYADALLRVIEGNNYSMQDLIKIIKHDHPEFNDEQAKEYLREANLVK